MVGALETPTDAELSRLVDKVWDSLETLLDLLGSHADFPVPPLTIYVGLLKRARLYFNTYSNPPTNTHRGHRKTRHDGQTNPSRQSWHLIRSATGLCNELGTPSCSIRVQHDQHAAALVLELVAFVGNIVGQEIDYDGLPSSVGEQRSDDRFGSLLYFLYDLPEILG